MDKEFDEIESYIMKYDINKNTNTMNDDNNMGSDKNDPLINDLFSKGSSDHITTTTTKTIPNTTTTPTSNNAITNKIDDTGNDSIRNNSINLMDFSVLSKDDSIGTQKINNEIEGNTNEMLLDLVSSFRSISSINNVNLDNSDLERLNELKDMFVRSQKISGDHDDDSEYFSLPDYYAKFNFDNNSLLAHNEGDNANVQIDDGMDIDPKEVTVDDSIISINSNGKEFFVDTQEHDVADDDSSLPSDVLHHMEQQRQHDYITDNDTANRNITELATTSLTGFEINTSNNNFDDDSSSLPSQVLQHMQQKHKCNDPITIPIITNTTRSNNKKSKYKSKTHNNNNKLKHCRRFLPIANTNIYAPVIHKKYNCKLSNGKNKSNVKMNKGRSFNPYTIHFLRNDEIFYRQIGDNNQHTTTLPTTTQKANNNNIIPDQYKELQEENTKLHLKIQNQKQIIENVESIFKDKLQMLYQQLQNDNLNHEQTMQNQYNIMMNHMLDEHNIKVQNVVNEYNAKSDNDKIEINSLKEENTNLKKDNSDIAKLKKHESSDDNDSSIQKQKEVIQALHLKYKKQINQMKKEHKRNMQCMKRDNNKEKERIKLFYTKKLKVLESILNENINILNQIKATKQSDSINDENSGLFTNNDNDEMLLRYEQEKDNLIKDNESIRIKIQQLQEKKILRKEQQSKYQQIQQKSTYSSVNSASNDSSSYIHKQVNRNDVSSANLKYVTVKDTSSADITPYPMTHKPTISSKSRKNMTFNHEKVKKENININIQPKPNYTSIGNRFTTNSTKQEEDNEISMQNKLQNAKNELDMITKNEELLQVEKKNLEQQLKKEKKKYNRIELTYENVKKKWNNRIFVSEEQAKKKRNKSEVNKD